jgi:hypothetical protein
MIARGREPRTIKENQSNKGNQTMARGGKRKGAGRKLGAKDKQPRGSPVIIAPGQERRELREAAREFTDDALKALVKICNGGQSESARVSAANALLDRGYGRPVQTIDSTITRKPGEFTGIPDAELERIAKGSDSETAADTAEGSGQGSYAPAVGKAKLDRLH